MQPMDWELLSTTVGNSVHQADLEGVFPSVTTHGLTGGHLEKQAEKERHKMNIFPFP